MAYRRLTDEEIGTIRLRLAKGEHYLVLAAEYGVSRETVRRLRA